MVFFLYFLPNNLPYHRFAVSVNKKIANAVNRNYIKRKMKELFRLHSSNLEKKHDLWVVIKKKFTRVDFTEPEKLFHRAIREIKNR